MLERLAKSKETFQGEAEFLLLTISPGGIVGRPVTSLYEMSLMYVCDLARVWRPLTSYVVHALPF